LLQPDDAGPGPQHKAMKTALASVNSFAKATHVGRKILSTTSSASSRLVGGASTFVADLSPHPATHQVAQPAAAVPLAAQQQATLVQPVSQAAPDAQHLEQKASHASRAEASIAEFAGRAHDIAGLVQEQFTGKRHGDSVLLEARGAKTARPEIGTKTVSFASVSTSDLLAVVILAGCVLMGTLIAFVLCGSFTPAFTAFTPARQTGQDEGMLPNESNAIMRYDTSEFIYRSHGCHLLAALVEQIQEEDQGDKEEHVDWMSDEYFPSAAPGR